MGQAGHHYPRHGFFVLLWDNASEAMIQSDQHIILLHVLAVNNDPVYHVWSTLFFTQMYTSFFWLLFIGLCSTWMFIGLCSTWMSDGMRKYVLGGMLVIFTQKVQSVKCICVCWAESLARESLICIHLREYAAQTFFRRNLAIQHKRKPQPYGLQASKI